MDVRMPDGTVVTNVPDDITQDDLMRRYSASKVPPIIGDKGASDLLPKTLSIAGMDTRIPLNDSVAAFLTGAGHQTQRILQGAQQAIGQGSPELAQQVQQENALSAPLEKQYPVSTALGSTLPYFAVPVGAAASIPAAMGKAALAGAIPAALEYGTPEERAQRAALAGVGGAVGSGIGAGIGRAFGPATMAGEAAGNQWNIPLRVAQTTESKPLQSLDAALQYIPGAGGVINRAKDASYSAFNRAVSNTFGQDATKITPELLGDAQSAVGGTIGALAERNALKLDTPLAQDIARIGQRASSNLSTDDAKIVGNQVTELLSHLDPNTGIIPGTNYRAWRSDVGALAKSSGGTLGNVLGDLRGAVTKAMDRSISPEDAAAWAKANREYFNVKQVANAARTSPEGNLSPSQLLTAVNQAQQSSRFGAGNDLAELARYAKPTLGDKIPNSGTAQRLLWQQLLTNPVALPGLLAGGNQMMGESGIDPRWGLGLLAPYLAARGMAGKPLSEVTKAILQRGGGGLLGGLGSDYALLGQ